MPSTDLPGLIPVFPLPDVVLFPGVPLPLHIFEPRYRRMVADALAGPGLIGMVLLRGDGERQKGTPEVYRVGCAGKIIEATPLANGNVDIMLAGIREFEIVSEQRDRAYLQASVIWRPALAGAVMPTGVRRELVAVIERYARGSLDDATRDLLHDSSIPDATLVNIFALWLDLSPVEKQCILEVSTALRARRLRDILEFRLFAVRSGSVENGLRLVH